MQGGVIMTLTSTPSPDVAAARGRGHLRRRDAARARGPSRRVLHPRGAVRGAAGDPAGPGPARRAVGVVRLGRYTIVTPVKTNIHLPDKSAAVV